MAAPSKNFTDPTGLSGFLRSAPSVAQGAIPPIFAPYRAAAWMPAPAFAGVMVAIGKTPAAAVPVSHFPPIPPPPMGRQVISTFPPIYRERVTVAPRAYPTVGQIFPDPMSAFLAWQDAPALASHGQLWP